MNVTVHEDAAAAVRAVADLVAAAAAEAGERFAICLTGGSTPKALYELLASDEYAPRIDWERWHVFIGDERRVPLDDERSNWRMASAALLDRVPIPSAQQHPLTDADQYEGLLRAFFGERPDFDVLLLGMGGDGHTASLFPGSVALMEDERWVIAPPDEVAGTSRLTLTFPALAAARRRVFLATGGGKADALARIAAGEDLPAGRVRDPEWHVDRAAAAQLSDGP